MPPHVYKYYLARTRDYRRQSMIQHHKVSFRCALQAVWICDVSWFCGLKIFFIIIFFNVEICDLNFFL